MDIYKEFYCGWLVLAVLEDCDWFFECHKPESDIHVDQRAYETAEQAIGAAREFVQHDTAKTAILQALAS